MIQKGASIGEAFVQRRVHACTSKCYRGVGSGVSAMRRMNSGIWFPSPGSDLTNGRVTTLFSVAVK